MTPRVVAIGGGKGGVGKSLVAANVGIFLSTLGKRVVLVDGSFGAPNLHIFAGVPRPSRSLSEALAAHGPSLAEIAVPTHVPGVKLIAGVNDPPWVAEPGSSRVQVIAQQLRQLSADWVVIDLGPGLSSPTLDLFLEADIGLLVGVPDPTSIELMHRFVKAAFLKHLDRLGLGHHSPASAGSLHLGHLGGAARDAREHEGGAPSALEIYFAAVEQGATDLGELRAAILQFAPHLVINSARSKSDMELGRAVASAARRRLAVPIRYLGHLEYDEAVWASTRRRRPLLIEHPETRIAKCFERIARGLLAVQPPKTDGEVLPSDSHYELLEVPPTASFEDIRRANRRIRDIYGAESIAISGLYDPASLEAVHRRLDLAYTSLMDAAKRKEYDMELFPDGVPMPVSHPPVVSGDAPSTRPAAKVDDPATLAVRPPMPEISPQTEFTGALLRQIREAIGIELREIAEKSKIGMAYLHALEGEVFAKLPAAVYVRGFLSEYARALGLDSERVKQTYLARFKAARPSPDEDDVEHRERERKASEGLSRPKS
ncbi:MAG: helix-turn-helix domain-containing protein [Deltaproteobacteria bacterium]|nr:helix-turn-helix domain-containing protein [Deltaproteobacteria bacterium]MDQ3301522.1 helix-turn-helix domain-containing protein [Myxococcota bacterium]